MPNLLFKYLSTTTLYKKLKYGELTYGKTFVQRKIRTARSPMPKMPNAKSLYGEVSLSIMSLRQNILMAKCLTAKYLTGKCPMEKWTTTKILRTVFISHYSNKSPPDSVTTSICHLSISHHSNHSPIRSVTTSISHHSYWSVTTLISHRLNQSPLQSATT